jgi:hypothetical protein
VLLERVVTTRDVTQGLEGQTEVKETVGNEPARMSLVTTAT